MPITPENAKISPKSVSSLGKISERFLIPCRQIGLSRKRKTSNSALKIPFATSSYNENPNTSPDSLLAKALPKSPLVYSPDALSTRSSTDSQKNVQNNVQTSSKSAPSLGKINQRFLTPCRPVGLCKKRETPKFLNSPLAKPLPESPLVNSPDELSKRNSKSEKTAKKSLENDFVDVEKQKTEFGNAPNVSVTVEPLKESSLNNANVYEKSMSDVKGKRRKKIDVRGFTETKVNKDLEQYENNNDNFANVERMKINMILDDDDSNIPSKKNAIIKIPSDSSNIERKNENKKNYNHDFTLVQRKQTQIPSSDFSCSLNSEKSIESNVQAVENKIVTKHSTTNNSNEDSDDDFVIVKKKRRVLSDDSSDSSNSQKSSTTCNDYKVVNKQTELHIVLARISSTGNKNEIDDFTTGIEKMSVLSESDISNSQKSSSRFSGSKTKKRGTKPIKEMQKKLKRQFSNLHSWDCDDDDAFTSSPDMNHNEKANILKEVNALESRIKEKQKKLENLKQADIYKTKHNIDELDRLIEIWKNGGIAGLNELLRQLQSKYSSITMEMLLANLNISKDVAQIKLGLELEEAI